MSPFSRKYDEKKISMPNSGSFREALEPIDHVLIVGRQIVFVRVTIIRSSICVGSCIFDQVGNLLHKAEICTKL